MTDTTIRVQNETRQWLKVYASMHDFSQDEAIRHALSELDAPKPDEIK